MMDTISVSELATQQPCNNQVRWFDVRSATEFAAGHIPGTINIPLDELEVRVEDIIANLPIVLICKGGHRARMAAGLLEPCRTNITVLDGGTDAWAKAGLPLVISRKTRWSLERQVRLAAGVLILCGTIATAVTSHAWLLLTGFVGLGLTFAGVTDLCPMGVLLARMPWNRARKCAIRSPDEKRCV
jgi:rhodanese-related sulfurtransferase